jgi:hypothetical protein
MIEVPGWSVGEVAENEEEQAGDGDQERNPVRRASLGVKRGVRIEASVVPHPLCDDRGRKMALERFVFGTHG